MAEPTPKIQMTLARVAGQLLPLYCDVQEDGRRVTGPESFSQDIIADVLIWAAWQGEDLDEVLDSARGHADYELAHPEEPSL